VLNQGSLIKKRRRQEKVATKRKPTKTSGGTWNAGERKAIRTFNRQKEIREIYESGKIERREREKDARETRWRRKSAQD